MFSRLFRRADRRDIFRYWDGKRYRYADPLVVWHDIWSDPNVDPAVDFQAATGIGSDGSQVEYDAEAEQRVLAMIRKVFGVQQWSEKVKGLTVRETFILMWGFLTYVNGLKKKHAPLQMPSQPSVLESSASPSTTEPEPALSSMPTESTGDAPDLSSKPSAAP